MRQVYLTKGKKMLIEDLIIEIICKKDGLKYINNYVIDEISENWYSYKGVDGEIYDKVIGLLHANLSIIETLERILTSYQDEIDKNYAELLKTEI